MQASDLNGNFPTFPRETLFQILDSVEDPPRLALVCKQFNGCAKDLFISLFKRLDLFKEGCQDLKGREWLRLVKEPAFKYSGADFFILETFELYKKMEISFGQSLLSIKNWTTTRDHFEGTYLNVERVPSQEFAFSDALYINPLNCTMLQNECCQLSRKYDQDYSLVFPLKPLLSLQIGQIALNYNQRGSTCASIGETLKIKILNINEIAQATFVGIRISETKKTKTTSDAEIKLSFLQKFDGHILNLGHEISFYVKNEFTTIQVIQLESNGDVNFALLKSDVTKAIITDYNNQT